LKDEEDEEDEDEGTKRSIVGDFPGSMSAMI